MIILSWGKGLFSKVNVVIDICNTNLSKGQKRQTSQILLKGKATFQIKVHSSANTDMQLQENKPKKKYLLLSKR